MRAKGPKGSYRSQEEPDASYRWKFQCERPARSLRCTIVGGYRREENGDRVYVSPEQLAAELGFFVGDCLLCGGEADYRIKVECFIASCLPIYRVEDRSSSFSPGETDGTAAVRLTA